MLHGAERDAVDLNFARPADCAAQIERDEADVGLVPVAEIARQGLDTIPGLGIACRGAVRSILLVARVPWKQVATLAADANSRTSVRLAEIILRERHGVVPQITAHAPDLETMLEVADAALLIGDAALRVEPDRLAFECLDLGAAWFALTGLPMVFAMWAGQPGAALDLLVDTVRASYEFGRLHIDEIVDQEHANRGISKPLAAKYLREHIRYIVGPKEHEGLETFFELAGLTRSAAVTR